MSTKKEMAVSPDNKAANNKNKSSVGDAEKKQAFHDLIFNLYLMNRVLCTGRIPVDYAYNLLPAVIPCNPMLIGVLAYFLLCITDNLGMIARQLNSTALQTLKEMHIKIAPYSYRDPVTPVDRSRYDFSEPDVIKVDCDPYENIDGKKLMMQQNDPVSILGTVMDKLLSVTQTISAELAFYPPELGEIKKPKIKIDLEEMMLVSLTINIDITDEQIDKVNTMNRHEATLGCKPYSDCFRNSKVRERIEIKLNALIKLLENGSKLTYEEIGGIDSELISGVMMLRTPVFYTEYVRRDTNRSKVDSSKNNILQILGDMLPVIPKEVYRAGDPEFEELAKRIVTLCEQAAKYAARRNSKLRSRFIELKNQAERNDSPKEFGNKLKTALIELWRETTEPHEKRKGPRGRKLTADQEDQLERAIKYKESSGGSAYAVASHVLDTLAAIKTWKNGYPNSEKGKKALAQQILRTVRAKKEAAEPMA